MVWVYAHNFLFFCIYNCLAPGFLKNGAWGNIYMPRYWEERSQSSKSQGKGKWDIEEKKANASWYVTKQDTASQGNLVLVIQDIFPTGSVQVPHLSEESSEEEGWTICWPLFSPPCPGLKFVLLEVNSLVGWVTHFLCVVNGQASL